MTDSALFSFSDIGDELLSAYIDGELNAAERRRVEQALAADARVRERHQALAATVQLMRQAPTLRTPRMFTLTEAQVAAAGGKVRGAAQPGWWRRLTAGWVPRAAAAALALLLVAVVSAKMLLPTSYDAAAPPPQAVSMEMPAEVAAKNEYRAQAGVRVTKVVEQVVKEAEMALEAAPPAVEGARVIPAPAATLRPSASNQPDSAPTTTPALPRASLKEAQPAAESIAANEEEMVVDAAMMSEEEKEAEAFTSPLTIAAEPPAEIESRRGSLLPWGGVAIVALAILLAALAGLWRRRRS